MKKYILALDQGTTSSRAIIFDKNLDIIGTAQSEFPQIYPQNGYVEHNALDIYASQYSVMTEVLAKNSINPNEILSVGITNQRETTIMWDKNTGIPIHNAIVWQCRRTASICRDICNDGFDKYITNSTGLPVDAYFSGTKVKWLLDNVPYAREKAQKGEILFGTVDTWLIWKMTGGQKHVTDYTNASRTMLFNIHTLEWDEKILNYLNIPKECLPKVQFSDENFGEINIEGVKIPIHAVAGDQQSALFGQRCFEKGQAKTTYGTGCFLLVNTKDKAVKSQNGLITTIGIAQNKSISYALEGSVFVGGAVIQWLRDELKMIGDSFDSEYFASKVQDNGGVYVVPAFTGLGAPHWDMEARGAILGITRGTKSAHIIRASLESIAYQVNDVVMAMEKDFGEKINLMRIDGGASANNVLAQFQADITNTHVVRPFVRESTALGVALLAGMAMGFWDDIENIGSNHPDTIFECKMPEETRQNHIKMWNKAVGRSKNWNE